MLRRVDRYVWGRALGLSLLLAGCAPAEIEPPSAETTAETVVDQPPRSLAPVIAIGQRFELVHTVDEHLARATVEVTEVREDGATLHIEVQDGEHAGLAFDAEIDGPGSSTQALSGGEAARELLGGLTPRPPRPVRLGESWPCLAARTQIDRCTYAGSDEDGERVHASGALTDMPDRDYGDLSIVGTEYSFDARLEPAQGLVERSERRITVHLQRDAREIETSIVERTIVTAIDLDGGHPYRRTTVASR